MNSHVHIPNKNIRWLIVLGNIFDHCNTTLFSFLAPFMARAFFPYHDYIMTLIATYTLVSMSLIARPVGALFFAKKIPKLGAKNALCMSFIGVGASTALIAVLPDFTHIGYYAPVLLALLRVIQSFFAAGENAIAPIYIQNYFKKDKQVKSSSLFSSSTMFGIFLSSSMSAAIAIFAENNIDEYISLWRIPYICGIMTVFIGIILFKQSSDLEVKIDFTNNILATVWRNKLKFLKIIIASGFCYHTNSMAFVFLNSFVPKVTAITISQMMSINSALLMLDIFLLPVIGSIIEKINYSKVMVRTVSLYLIVTTLFFYFMGDKSFVYVTVMRISIVVLGLIFLTPFFVWMRKLCEPEEKYAIGGLGYAIGTELFGRTTPIICFWLWHFYGTTYSPMFYSIILCLLTIIVLRIDTKQPIR